METEKKDEKNKISVGLIISRDEIEKNKIFPDEVKKEIAKADFYLLIYISREDVVKISCFPSKTDNIKKILVRLKEFSPELVKGISYVLKELKLSEDIIHTTGLCYEMENCFYETYLIGDFFQSEENIKKVKENFMAIGEVISVIIEDIPKLM
ncbi:MAG: hypothetical protein ACTSQP_16335 [Promethearchaeota archaeon]